MSNSMLDPTQQQPETTDVEQRSECEKMGKTTCKVIIVILAILILIAICWWLFQICSSSSSNTEDEDEKPGTFCEILGDIGQLLGDVAEVLSIALNNLFWVLALGILFLLGKAGWTVFDKYYEKSSDNIVTPNKDDNDNENDENDENENNDDDYKYEDNDEYAFE